MQFIRCFLGLFLVCCLLLGQFTVATAGADNNKIQKLRFSQTAEKVRIVLDTTAYPEFTALRSDHPLQLVIDMPNTVNAGAPDKMMFNDPLVEDVTVTATRPDQIRVTVNLKMAGMYAVHALKGPNRLFIDVIKTYEKKVQQTIAPGLTYTSWQRGQAQGPVWAHVLDVDPQAGFVCKPVLSNDKIAALETLLPMAQRYQAVAAVNGSYFSPNGEIIGLLKLNGQIVSTPELARTAVGLLASGEMMIDQVAYQGTLTMPDGRTHLINGVNRERGEDELVLYNAYYGENTGTNLCGTEYVIQNDKITAVTNGHTALSPTAYVLSAHGLSAKSLAGLKAGDTVKVTQTLGPVWDKTTAALGAGPMLVKNGVPYVTTKVEEFGSDVAGGRAPRTALGVTKNGHMLFVVVDGRQQNSIGLTLLEMAFLMQDLGAETAINLDGGGSSEMVLNNRIVNSPSDGHERALGAALLVMPTKLAN
ncbi:MAG: PhosphodieSPTER glycosidase [Firmicutes bacterium]|nr:PhosphodieSPTER glycosidase [Bacillota bacterium]